MDEFDEKFSSPLHATPLDNFKHIIIIARECCEIGFLVELKILRYSFDMRTETRPPKSKCWDEAFFRSFSHLWLAF